MDRCQVIPSDAGVPPCERKGGSKSPTSSQVENAKTRVLSTWNSSQKTNAQTVVHSGNDARLTLATGSQTWISKEHRKKLQELVRRQKRARTAARKLAEERERERNQRIADNLAATAEAAKLAAKRSLHLKRGDSSSRHREHLKNGIDVENDEIPSECVLRASQLLAEENNVVFKKPRCLTTLIVPSSQHSSRESGLSRNLFVPASAAQPVYAKTRGSKNCHSVVSSTPLFNPSKFLSEHLYKSFPDGSNVNTASSRLFPGRSGAAIVSTSLPLKSRTAKSFVGSYYPKVPRTKGFGVQVDLSDPISFRRHTEVITPWKDAESEQARLQARLCVSRARRFVRLDADGDDANGDDSGEALVSSSSSSASSKSSCISEAQQVDDFLEPTKDLDDMVMKVAESSHWMPEAERPGVESGTPLRSLFDTHLRYLQTQSKSESDPLRFMEVYKQKCQQLTTHPRGDSRVEASSRAIRQVHVNETHFNYGDCTSVSEVDKTSEAASSIPSLVEETVHPTKQAESRHQTEIQQRQRLAPAALGLSLTAELHRYETLSASEQHIAGLEMTRQISQAQAEGLSIYHLAKAGYLHDAQSKGDPNQIGATDSHAGSSTGSYYAPRRIDADASSMNVYDANVTPSNLEASTALCDLVDLRSEQFKGILQQRASELHARRHEAELLLKYAARLDREERKVVALESRAVKALTRSKDRRPAAEAYIPPQQSSHSPSPSLQTLKAQRESPPSPTPPPHPPPSPDSAAPPPSSTSLLCSSPIISHSPGRVSVVEAENASPVEAQKSIVSLSDRPPSKSNTKLISSQLSNSRQQGILCSCDNGTDSGEFDGADFSQQHLLLRDQYEHHNHQPQILSPRRLSQDSTNSTSSSPSGLRAYSDSLSSSEFVSQLEARLVSLQRELRRNEKLLSRIDAQKKMANKDRLMRLETTLENHRKFCLEIINNIKLEISSCHQSLCEKTSQLEAASTVLMTPSAATRISSSPEPSFSSKPVFPSFREPKKDVENTTSFLPSSSFNAEEEAVESICTVSVEVEETSAPLGMDSSKSPLAGKTCTSNSGVGENGRLEHLVCLDAVKSASSRTSHFAKLGETIASEISSESSSSTQRLTPPMEMNLIVEHASMYSATLNDVKSEECVSSAETLASGMSLAKRILSPVETKMPSLNSTLNEQNGSVALKRSESVESLNSGSPEEIIVLKMSSKVSVLTATPSMHTKTEPLKSGYDEQRISSAASTHSNTGSGSPVEMLGSEVSSKVSTSTRNISSPVDAETILKPVVTDGESKAAHSGSLKVLEIDVADSPGETMPSEMASEMLISVESTPLPAETKSRVDAKVEVETKEASELKRITSLEVLLPGKKPELVGSNQSEIEIKENGGGEEEKGDSSCLIETVASELSLETPSLSSDTHSPEVQELKSAKTSIHQITTGSNSESALDTGDVYTEDFEDEVFADEDERQQHGLVESADAVSERPVSASTPSSDCIEVKTNALLDEFTDRWLDDFIGEGIDSVLEEVEETMSTDYEEACRSFPFYFLPPVITDTTGMVVNAPSRTVPLFKDVMEFFFQLRASSKPGTFEEALNSIQYPPRFTEKYAEEEDLQICERVPQSRLVNRSLFFDLVRIGMLDIFAGEDEDVKNNREPRLSSARLHMWRGRRRPESQSRWEAILAPQLEAILGMSLDPAACLGPSPPILPKPQVFDPSVLRSSLVRWTLNSKTCWIEQLLEIELRDEDSSWFNFKPFEEQVINTAVRDIANELAEDMVVSVLKKLNYGNKWKKQREEEQKRTENSVRMGVTHSHGTKGWAAPQLNSKPKSTALPLDAFITDMVKQMVERTVDAVIEEKQPKNSNVVKRTEESRMPSTNSKVGESDLEVLSSTNDFFRTALEDDHLNESDSTPCRFMEDDELSSSSASSSLQSTSSSSPLEDSTNALAASPLPGIPEDQLVGLIVNISSRVAPLFKDGMQFFWNLRTTCKSGTFEKALREATYPPRFSMDCVEKEDVELCESADEMSFLNRALFFDLIREILQRIYEGEDEDVQVNRTPVVNSARYRLWLGTTRPNSLPLLKRIIRTNLETEFGISFTPACDTSQNNSILNLSPPRVLTDMNRLSRLAQWTVQRKDWLDQRLELEMRADEHTWYNYKPFEQKLLDNLTVMVMAGTFNEVYDECVKKVAKEIYYEDVQLLNGEPEPEMKKNFETDFVRVRSPSSITRHSRHRPRRSRSRSSSRQSKHHNDRSRTRSPESPSGIKIQLKPLVLASDNEKLRNQDIDFIETSGFVQTAFRSSRSGDQTFKVPSETSSTGGVGLNTVSAASGQYEALVRERAHEAAIFGTGHSQPLDSLCLGARPSDDGGGGGDGGQKLVPTTQVVKEIIHPRLKKNKTLAYREWAARLNDLASARRQSRQSVTSH
uniref:Serine rich adhesin for platelets n=1 Tax=Echinococcus canadensis TaxID=519352 RepID=A0A915EWD2_9CEST